MTTRAVTNGPVRLHVVEEGNQDGPTLVLVHGWPDTHALWDRVTPLLSDTFRIIRFDNRGAGKSTVPRAVADYRLEHLAADLFAVIDAVRPAEPVHLLGHDWGAVLCWEAVCEADAPGRIASYTSVSGPNLDHLGLWMRRRVRELRLLGPGEQALASAYTVLFQIPGLPVPVLRRWLSRHWPAFVGVFDRTDPALIGPVAPTLADDMVHGLKLYRANLRRRLADPRPRRTDIPVQLVQNLRDRAVRPVGYEDTSRWVTDLRVEPLDAGHWSPRSHPAELAAATARFVLDIAATTRPA
ncbi:alpha/beta fold hydrolase [Rhodococcus coprophilus]|uniref:Hydrolase n=1 Tax=Rhodococcus coprophilus TaxID=38310 RepID=A0A2X4TNJ5_9NOCA|nr:alpha/beta fold hydrolase [Rhodococcus coprophilus]MBM7460947.1 pimeloyl-ACP methyl ester carboxylesterase [Rhodococcus coprophilus]SQI28751.1 hydrolase [Rhodococcus coprophilus]